MATKIITKNGSGAPSDGDLSVGELAVDLTNKQLYTKDNNGVIKIGSGAGEGNIQDGDTDGQITTWDAASGEWTPDGAVVVKGGNVGIGTSSLSSRLTIREDSSSVVVDALQIENIGGGNNEGSRIKFVCDNSANSEIFSQQSSNNFGSLTFGTFSVDGSTVGGQIVLSATSDGSTYSPRVSLSTGGTERMRIDSNGNVGIGTTSPNSLLDLRGTSTNQNVLQLSNSAGVSDGGADNQIRVTCNGDTNWGNLDIQAYHTIFTQNGAERMRIDSSGNVGIGTASMSSVLDIASPNATTRTHIGLGANSDNYFTCGSAGVQVFRSGTTERMRIDSSGNLLVGKTSDDIALVGCQLNATGAVLGTRASASAMSLNRTGTDGTIADFRKNGTTVGSISVTSSATTYNTSSDVRLKENIVDAPAGNIDAIRVRSFDWKSDGSHQTYGMVAQELVDVAPEAVLQGETEDDMWGVDYSKLVPMMIKEIQDLKAEVAALKGA